MSWMKDSDAIPLPSTFVLVCTCVYSLYILNVQYNIYVWNYLFRFNIFVRKMFILRLLLLFFLLNPAVKPLHFTYSTLYVAL